jgi:type IV secretion system protein VirD4
MKPIESGIGYLAGYGVSLWMFIQDLNQIKDIYERWGTFLSNCSVRMAFGTNDVETAKVLSEMLGTTTIRVEGEGTSSDAGFKLLGSKNSTSTNVSETARPLMTPDEVMRMPFDAQLIFVQGGKPIVAEKVFYFSDPFFKGKFDSWDG